MAFAGEMLGTVHRVLLETHQSELKPGSVLLLKQVGGAPWLVLAWLPAFPPSLAREKLGPASLELLLLCMGK